MRSPRSLLACTLALSSLLVACGSDDDTAAPSPLRRATAQGTVDGVAVSGTYAWLGLPYAAAPVGALRWMPPAAPAAWTGVREARAFGHACAQAGRFYSPAPNDAPYGLAVRDSIGKPVGSEDCLTLNVWRPASATTNLPVIVFIHGGSNISGYSADPVQDGATLARKADAVVVTINYRLGAFGWLNLAALKTGDATVDSGNFGTLDQAAALKYVKENIAAFGGDTSNVTVMGQSAGAVDVWALLVSPLTTGLMHKAAPLSGGLQFTTAATAQTYANGLLAASLVADGTVTDTTAAAAWVAARTNAQVAAYLRGKTADQLLQVVLANPALAVAPAVIPDGTVVAANPAAAIAADAYRQVPLLAGNTRDEGKLFGTTLGAYKPSEYDRFTLQYDFAPDGPASLSEADLLTAAVLPVDTPVTGWNARAATITNGLFLAGATASLNAVAARQPAKVWYYRFDWDQQPVPFNTVYGAVHALDVPFVFGNFGPSIFSHGWSAANQGGREALSDAMVRSIAAFARTGDPNHAGLGVTWANWPSKVVFGATPTAARITAE